MFKRILIAEDTQSVLRVTIAVIEALIPGVEILTATDGDMALNFFNHTPNIDLIITDIEMPDIDGETDGLWLYDQLKGKVPFIIYSGKAELLKVIDLHPGDQIAEKPVLLETWKQLLSVS